MRQLGVAFSAYMQDYDDALPGAYCCEYGDEDRQGGWISYAAFPVNLRQTKYDASAGSVYPYVRNAAVYVCPDDREGKLTGDSYAVNSCLMDSATISNGLFYSGKHAGEIESPSATMLLGEESSYDPLVNSTDDAYFRYQNNRFSVRHNGGSVVLFVDSHARWFTKEDLLKKSLLSQTPDGRECPP